MTEQFWWAPGIYPGQIRTRSYSAFHPCGEKSLCASAMSKTAFLLHLNDTLHLTVVNLSITRSEFSGITYASFRHFYNRLPRVFSTGNSHMLFLHTLPQR